MLYFKQLVLFRLCCDRTPTVLSQYILIAWNVMLWNSMKNSSAAMLSYDSRTVKTKQKPSLSER